MPNRYYSPVNPEYEGGKMADNGKHLGNDDGREAAKQEKVAATFKEVTGDPNSGVKGLGKQKGAE